MYCLACGKPLSERGVVCGVCGTHQKATPSPGWQSKEVQAWSSENPAAWVGPKSTFPLKKETGPPPAAANPGVRPPPDPPRAKQRPPGMGIPKKSNLLPMLVLGFMGIVFLLLVASNWYMKKNVETKVLNLPSGMMPCVEAVTTMRTVVEMVGKNLTEAQLKKDGGYTGQVKKCPSLKVKKLKNGWLVEATPKKVDDTICRIWSDPDKKVTTNCDETLVGKP